MGSAGREQLEPGGVGPFHQFRLLVESVESVESVRFFRGRLLFATTGRTTCWGPSIRQHVRAMLMKPQYRERWQTDGTSGLLSCQPAEGARPETFMYPGSDNAITDALSAMADGLPEMHGISWFAICSHDGPSPMRPAQPMRRALVGLGMTFLRGANFLPKPQACDSRGQAALTH